MAMADTLPDFETSLTELDALIHTCKDEPIESVKFQGRTSYYCPQCQS